MAHRTRKPAIAALSVELTPGQREYLLIPDGEFHSSDGSGRPLEVSAWRNNAEIAARVVERAQSRQAKMVVDYEHQTLNSEKNGKPAPAAGWIDRASLRYEPGIGILGVIDWTPTAEAFIAGQEYKYLSPVFAYDTTTGEVLALRHIALTNDPGLDMPAVALRALTDFSTEPQEDHLMLDKLLAAIGLAANVGEAEALSAIASLKAKADSVAGKDAEIAVLSAKKPNPAEYVPVATMQEVQTENVSLKSKLNDIEVGTVVQAALKSGQLLPAQKEWAEDLGKSNLAALKSYVEKTPPNPALAGMQSEGKKVGEEGGNGLSAAELAVCKATGTDPADFLKTKSVAA